MLGSWELRNLPHMAGQIDLFFGKRAALMWAESILTCLGVGNWETSWVSPHGTTCRQSGGAGHSSSRFRHLHRRCSGSLCSQRRKNPSHFQTTARLTAFRPKHCNKMRNNYGMTACVCPECRGINTGEHMVEASVLACVRLRQRCEKASS